jgi:NTE family protein
VRAEPVNGPIALGLSLVETAIEGCQAEHVLDPCNMARSVYVDTGAVGAVDFDITPAEQATLLAEGAAAAEEFLERWNYPRWLEDCRRVVGARRGMSAVDKRI